MRGREKGYANNLSISRSILECWFWIHLLIFSSPSKSFLNSQDSSQDRPRWLGFPRWSSKASGEGSYRREINQPAAVNSVQISRFRAYGSYENAYGSYGVEFATQQFIFLTIIFSSEFWFEWSKISWNAKSDIYKINISF
jgi:hypothetical protein